MRLIRERWIPFTGVLLLLAVGNFATNRPHFVREWCTYLLLASATMVFALFEKLGWSQWLYLSPVIDDPVIETEHALVRRQTFIVFSTLSVVLIVYVTVTGGIRSPMLWVLGLMPLLIGLRYGFLSSVLASLLLTAGYAEPQLARLRFAGSPDAVFLSLPMAGLFGTVLRHKIRDGFRSTSTRIGELLTLIDVSKMLETAIDLETTISLLLINAERIVDADISAVYLYDAGSSYLRIAAPSTGDNSSVLSPSLSVKALESGNWRLSSDDVLRMSGAAYAASDATLPQWSDTISSDGMFASLVGSEGVLGLIYVARSPGRTPFQKADEGALRRFTSHVSMPLQKALYQENLSVLAFRDQMTDLSNFRYFEQRLTEELVRAKRYKQKVTLLLLDIDHFKKFNDDYGHKAGDALLKQFGYVLKECLRESDLPARYGGEEFIVICPGISRAEARVVAERARITLEQTEFDLGESLLGESTTAHITVSIGSATFPNHAIEHGDLVRQADRALYAAKGRGRNVVVSCDDIPTVDEAIAARSVA